MSDHSASAATDAASTRFPQVHVECTLEDADGVNGRLLLLGASGIEQRDASTLVKGGPKGVTLVASFDDEASANDALSEFAGDARIEWIEGDDWADAWKAHWKPMRLGDRVVIVPSWIEFDAQPGDVVMRLDPGRAFGTGQHASTALATAALERRLRDRAESLVIDVGCGSGILSFAALLLGAERAVLCDIDADSIEVACENAERLGLSSRIDARVGSTDVLRERSTLVLANIEAGVLIPLAESIAALVADGGALVLSGVLEAQRDAVVAAYAPFGLRLERCEQQGEWVAPELVRR
ncbi:MAG: 50S ribosomal protein L11 methyltransferase [Myxococcales bacterium]|nr:50S ribosomal protein L11 methyltransferase [Myxococcales bacterium]